MSKKSAILIFIQFFCILYFFFSKSIIADTPWILIQIIGIVLGLWGIIEMKIGNFNIQPEVKSNATFISSGPYTFIRNPMYAGLIFVFLPSIISAFSFLRFLIFIIFVTVLILKMKMEEEFLSHKFNKSYLDYKMKTYRIIPFIF